MKKQNIAIISVVALILAVAVGYALFSQTLTINGTATASGNFNVGFTSIGEITKSGYTDKTGKNGANIAVITTTADAATSATSEEIAAGNGKYLKITVNKLDYPGAYVEIPVTITNYGSIPAKLKEIRQTDLTATDRAVKVTYTGIAASDTPITTDGTHSMTIKVEWDPAVNTTSENVEFSIYLDYEQVTVATTTAQ